MPILGHFERKKTKLHKKIGNYRPLKYHFYGGIWANQANSYISRAEQYLLVGSIYFCRLGFSYEVQAY